MAGVWGESGRRDEMVGEAGGAEWLNRCRPQPAVAFTPPLAKTAAVGVQIVIPPHHRCESFPAQPQAVLSKHQS